MNAFRETNVTDRQTNKTTRIYNLLGENDNANISTVSQSRLKCISLDTYRAAR